MLRPRVRQIVDNDGAETPRSFSTRMVSAFNVGPTIRASTSLRNVSLLTVSLLTVSNPSRAYAASKTFHSTRDRDPVTVGAFVATGTGISPSRSTPLYPVNSSIRSRPIAINAASCASS